MQARLLNYQYNQILKDVTKHSNRYFLHLVTAFESALQYAQPGSQPSAGLVEYESAPHLRNQAFHINFSKQIMLYDKNIFEKLQINTNSLELSSVKLQNDLVLEMQKSMSNLDSLDKLFKEDSNHPLKLTLDFMLYYYSKNHNSSIKDIVDKLKTFSQLQRVLLTEQVEIELKNTNPTLQKLIEYKELLNASESLDKRRHLCRDIFLAVLSSLLVPVAVGRSIYNLKKNGTWHFMWSDGQKLRAKLIEKIEKAEQLEAKPEEIAVVLEVKP